MNLFKKKIRCLVCGKNFKRVNERGRYKQICSGYSNYRNCVRMKVEESFLFELLINHEAIEDNQKFDGKEKILHVEQAIDYESLVDKVKEITVDASKEEICIYYKNETITRITEIHQTYWSSIK